MTGLAIGVTGICDRDHRNRRSRWPEWAIRPLRRSEARLRTTYRRSGQRAMVPRAARVSATAGARAARSRDRGARSGR
jgi:hypothetical protein